eukprot:975572-Pelagomonas_calceolata.AAC.4
MHARKLNSRHGHAGLKVRASVQPCMCITFDCQQGRTDPPPSAIPAQEALGRAAFAAAAAAAAAGVAAHLPPQTRLPAIRAAFALAGALGPPTPSPPATPPHMLLQPFCSRSPLPPRP